MSAIGDKMAFDLRIANKVSDDEQALARRLGCSGPEAASLSLYALGDVFRIASAPDRPAVWPRGGEPQ